MMNQTVNGGQEFDDVQVASILHAIHYDLEVIYQQLMNVWSGNKIIIQHFTFLGTFMNFTHHFPLFSQHLAISHFWALLCISHATFHFLVNTLHFYIFGHFNEFHTPLFHFLVNTWQFKLVFISFGTFMNSTQHFALLTWYFLIMGTTRNSLSTYCTPVGIV